MSSFAQNAPTLVSAFEDLFTPKIITTGQRPSESFIRNLAGHMIHPRSDLSGRVPMSVRNIERKFVETSKKEAAERLRLLREKREESKNEWKKQTRTVPTETLSNSQIRKLMPGTKRWLRQKLWEQKYYFVSNINQTNLINAYESVFKEPAPKPSR